MNALACFVDISSVLCCFMYVKVVVKLVSDRYNPLYVVSI